MGIISIVTVVYNGVESIEQTILSVINQSYSQVEFIVIDGGSTDGTVDVIKKYAGKIKYWESSADKGIYDAMNKGTQHSTGEFIIFMNAGDSFINNEVIALISTTIQHDDEVVYGNVVLKDKNVCTPHSPKPIKQLKYRMPFCHQAVFVSRRLLLAHPFNLNYKIAADFHLFRTLYLNRVRFRFVDLQIAYYDLSGVSSVKNIEMLKEICIVINEVKNKPLLLIRSYLNLLKINFKYLVRYTVKGY